MAGHANGDKFDPQSLSRPQFISHASSSVPSTPSQKPRDLRFHSRSPSPSRGINNQSPRSVVSEAVGKQTANRAQPVVCKYESGSEFRKRRIAYVDHKNVELPPPQKEPKKTLQPDEQDKLSGDMRELYDRLLPSQESEDRRARLVSKLDRILHEEWPGSDIRVNVFGSSGNLLSSTDSDVDICITTQNKELETIHPIAKLLVARGMEKVVCRAAAKVPIVKCWDPELHLAADLNVNNPLALQNTRMIKTYVQLDDRVRPLAKVIKYWTKQRLLNDAAYGATISSYTWTCMIINFLQRRDPPILPSLQKISDCRTRLGSGDLSPFADDLDALKKKRFGQKNKESLGELLFQFFRHYGYEFEFSKYVVSVREGRSVTRKEKGWHTTNIHANESRNSLCVEEPFTANRNLGNSADDYAWHGIHLEIRRAFDLLEDGLKLDQCCEQFEFPPEEKKSETLFQKPKPVPKPTLTRSVSQSNRSNHEPGSGRSRKGNQRNQSAQRAGNRRASSGAAFGNARAGLPFSPPLGSNPGDYFNMKGNLHEQLYQQYLHLQSQQEALRAQLERHAQQAAVQGRAGDLAGAGSPRPRTYATSNGISSPRMDNPPQTAPLLNGFMYHYPARGFPPPSPMSQTRTRDGTNTNPSSPSLVAAVPALRRNGHRASAPDGSAGSVRSQSQPGRSLPHPLTLHHQMHSGYDVSAPMVAPFPTARSLSQLYPQGQHGLQLPLAQQYPGIHATQNLENAMPKEYVGYYVAQSPQLGPQHYAAANQVTSPMTLRDPPQRPRRVTPDLAPPITNGQHTSRSLSPRTSNLRTVSSSEGDPQLPHVPLVVQSPTQMDPSLLLTPICSGPQFTPVTAPSNDGGPLIVNGSNSNPPSRATENVNGVPGPGIQLANELSPSMALDGYIRNPSLPLPTGIESSSLSHTEGLDNQGPSNDGIPPPPKPDRHISISPNGNAKLNGVHAHESAPLTAPLLSPVAEMRTPSPTQTRGFELYPAEANGGLLKAANIATAKQASGDRLPLKTEARPGNERRGSAPTPSSPAKTAVPMVRNTVPQAPSPPSKNEWQTAGVSRNKHKKNKSNASAKSLIGQSGQAMPANEVERKGG